MSVAGEMKETGRSHSTQSSSARLPMANTSNFICCLGRIDDVLANDNMPSNLFATREPWQNTIELHSKLKKISGTTKYFGNAPTCQIYRTQTGGVTLNADTRPPANHHFFWRHKGHGAAPIHQSTNWPRTVAKVDALCKSPRNSSTRMLLDSNLNCPVLLNRSHPTLGGSVARAPGMSTHKKVTKPVRRTQYYEPIASSSRIRIPYQIPPCAGQTSTNTEWLNANLAKM